ncbi:unnamed protein product [Prunus armeniaca]
MALLVYESSRPQHHRRPALTCAGRLDPPRPPSGRLDPPRPPSGSLAPPTPPRGRLDPPIPPRGRLAPPKPPRGRLDQPRPPRSRLAPPRPPRSRLAPPRPPNYEFESLSVAAMACNLHMFLILQFFFVCLNGKTIITVEISIAEQHLIV